MRWIGRLLAVLLIAWVFGFALFMLNQGAPAGDQRTDAIVAPTGGEGRVARGLQLLQARRARRLLVSGVAPEVRPIDLATKYGVPEALFACCVDLGRQAVDTSSNADETAAWLAAHRFRSVRLVTSDWHMARARMELDQALGGGVTVIDDGVPSDPTLTMLIAEYNKLILRRVALWLGWGG